MTPKTTVTHSEWTAPPEQLSLLMGELHIWRILFSRLRDSVDEAYETLSEDERQRAGRFRFEKDRVQSMLSRAALRSLLGRYLSAKPRDIVFNYGPSNKPGLEHPIPSDVTPFSFNVSHSGDIALIAIAALPNVGIDVEIIRPDFATAEVAKRFFSPGEVRKLQSLAKREQAEAFFNCWTRKEAYIKAVGVGLSIPLDSFDVEFGPGKQARLLEIRGGLERASAWWMSSLDAGDGYAAAVVARGKPATLAGYDYEAIS